MSQGDQEPWIRFQVKTFTRWANNYLKERKFAIQDLKTDFSDGYLLFHLLEILGGETISPRIKRVTKKIQKLDNIKVSLRHLHDVLGIQSSIGSEEVYAGDLKQLLSLLYALIRQFHLKGGKSNVKLSDMETEGHDEGTCKAALLDWCNKQLATSGQSIDSFLPVKFADGKVFEALLGVLPTPPPNPNEASDKDKKEKASNNTSPDATATKDVPSQFVDNAHFQSLRATFERAQSIFNIPQLLDAEDVLTGHLDEPSLMTYVAFYRNYLEKPTPLNAPVISNSPTKIANTTGVVIASNANAPPPVKPVLGRNSIAIDNVYVSDNDILKLFTLDPPSVFEHVWMRYLQNHAEITQKGIEHMVQSCPRLKSLVITFIGGSVNFPTTFVTDAMVEAISQLTSLTELSLFLEISALPILSKMISLHSLSLKFKPKDLTRYQPPKAKPAATNTNTNTISTQGSPKTAPPTTTSQSSPQSTAPTSTTTSTTASGTTNKLTASTEPKKTGFSLKLPLSGSGNATSTSSTATTSTTGSSTTLPTLNLPTAQEKPATTLTQSGTGSEGTGRKDSTNVKKGFSLNLPAKTLAATPNNTPSNLSEASGSSSAGSPTGGASLSGSQGGTGTQPQSGDFVRTPSVQKFGLPKINISTVTAQNASGQSSRHDEEERPPTPRDRGQLNADGLGNKTTPKCDEEVLRNAQKSFRALNPKPVEDEKKKEEEEGLVFVTSHTAFSLFAQALSRTLRRLTLENTSGNKWDLSGLCDGLDALEYLGLFYMPAGTTMKRRWQGKSLRHVELSCCTDIGLEAFSNGQLLPSAPSSASITPTDSDAMEVEGTPSISPKGKTAPLNLLAVTVTNRNSKAWDSLMAWIRLGQSALETLCIDGGIFDESDVLDICLHSKSLKRLTVLNSARRTNDQTEDAQIFTRQFLVQAATQPGTTLELIEISSWNIVEEARASYDACENVVVS